MAVDIELLEGDGEHHPRPKGRSPKGKTWSYRLGDWEDVALARMPPPTPPEVPSVAAEEEAQVQGVLEGLEGQEGQEQPAMDGAAADGMLQQKVQAALQALQAELASKEAEKQEAALALEGAHTKGGVHLHCVTVFEGLVQK